MPVNVNWFGHVYSHIDHRVRKSGGLQETTTSCFSHCAGPCKHHGWQGNNSGKVKMKLGSAQLNWYWFKNFWSLMLSSLFFR